MTGYFSVRNFERLQHYKDRNPVWIKLYNDVLDNYEFGKLPDASKAHLLAIWLLASRYDNRIPFDAAWVGSRINATGPVDLVGLVRAKFLVPGQACSNLLAEAEQVACLETETETETEKREDTEESVTSVGAPSPRKRGSRLPDGALLPDEWMAFAEAEGHADPQREWAKFTDYWRQQPGQKGVKLDWAATWRNWVRRSVENGKRPGNRSGGSGGRSGGGDAHASLFAAGARLATGSAQGGG